ncbi:Crp/Fnr family transcriptional regulator [Maribacter arenosus]|uniref:Crp/Fnr family transcriptional regulator n=1 Tax=Maribacter arenosus TaxID=1854708 RepID=A0ABR7V762_9FLAO|nr:Crp/Fnr family transcriptional regulator [Maribacter arenosus]MBD0849533.1 Crp/Fnr family transcriptional regulator [Maribacter arenosus]
MPKQVSTVSDKLRKEYSHLFEDELLNEIFEVGEFNTIKRGGVLIDIDDELKHIPLIIKGTIKISRKENDKELALYFLERGDTCAISFANCLHKRKSVFKGVVEDDAEMILLPIDKIEKWLVTYESWRHYIIDSYHFRLLEMVDSIDTLAFLKMKDRLLKYLKNKAKVSKESILEITHQEIAKDLNTSRVVITRLIQDLHDEGVIFSTRNKVRVI